MKINRRSFLLQFLMGAVIKSKPSTVKSNITLITNKLWQLVYSNDDKAKLYNDYKVANRIVEQDKVYFYDKENFHSLELPANKEIILYGKVLLIMIDKTFYIFKAL